MTTENYVAYIGIDWADRRHDIACYDCASGTWQEYIIQTRPQDLLDWVNQLRARYGEGKIAVGMEQKNRKEDPCSMPSASTITWFSFPSILVLWRITAITR